MSIIGIGTPIRFVLIYRTDGLALRQEQGFDMKIRIKGEMTLAEIKQALWEMLAQAESKYAIRYSRGATLFINPTNGFGDDVTPLREDGQPMTDLNSRGPYRSAADELKL